MSGFHNLLPWNAMRDMGGKGSRATLQRLLMSRHVADLRFLAALLIFGIVGVTLVFLFHMFEQLLASSDTLYNSWSNGFATIGAIEAAFLATLISLLSWAYQTGSKRLGIVDLFACEIAAICRVYAVVRMAPALIDGYRQIQRLLDASDPQQPTPIRLPVDFSKTRMTESYTPVMDHAVGELQVLDAEVVTSVTAFYTYRRAMLDYMLRAGSEAPDGEADHGCAMRWKNYLHQVIYMLFLSLESARHALDDLIEYEPNHAESAINILMSELLTWNLLLSIAHSSRDDTLHARLAMRYEGYCEAYRKCYHKAMLGSEYDKDNGDRPWLPARTTAPKLKELFDIVSEEAKRNLVLT
jgi:hypothetical protein